MQPSIKYDNLRKYQTDKFCVYALVCPLQLEVKYVGCTWHLHQRYSDHKNKDSQCRKSEWIRWLKSNGLLPLVVIIAEFSDKKEAIKLEKQLIFKHKHKLLNTQKNFKH